MLPCDLWLRIITLGVIVGLAGCSQSASTGADRLDRTAFGRPAVFRALPAGWHQYNDRGVSLGRRGGVSDTVVTSWAFDRSNRDGPATDLPRGEALISVLLLRRAEGGRSSPSLCRGVKPLAGYPRLRRLPLRLPQIASGTLEGRPAVAEYRILGRVARGYYLEVRVDVNAPILSRALRRKLQGALSALDLPEWPQYCRS